MFLWFWLIFISGLTIAYITFTRGLCLIRPIRTAILHNKCSASKAADIQTITKNLGFCDWFLLNHLWSQITQSIAHAVLKDISEELRLSELRLRLRLNDAEV